MAVERKTAANNNGYPSTVYGAGVVNASANKGAAVGDSGSKQEYVVEYIVDMADLPAQSEEDVTVYTFPEDAVIKQVDLFVVETLSGGTTGIDVGLAEPDGTAIDADGLVAAFAGTDVGTYAEGAGALIGTALAAAGQLDVSGDRTAGKVLLRMYYTKAQQ